MNARARRSTPGISADTRPRQESAAASAAESLQRLLGGGGDLGVGVAREHARSSSSCSTARGASPPARRAGAVAGDITALERVEQGRAFRSMSTGYRREAAPRRRRPPRRCATSPASAVGRRTADRREPRGARPPPPPRRYRVVDAADREHRQRRPPRTAGAAPPSPPAPPGLRGRREHGAEHQVVEAARAAAAAIASSARAPIGQSGSRAERSHGPRDAGTSRHAGARRARLRPAPRPADRSRPRARACRARPATHRTHQRQSTGRRRDGVREPESGAHQRAAPPTRRAATRRRPRPPGRGARSVIRQITGVTAPGPLGMDSGSDAHAGSTRGRGRLGRARRISPTRGHAR